MGPHRFLVSCVLAAILFAPSSLAIVQQQGQLPALEAPGFQPKRDYFSELSFEHIDTLSGTYVTKASEVRGMSGAQIGGRLEIQPGRGTHAFSARVPNKNLAVPANGPTTSGGAWQRVLKKPTEVERQ